MSHSSRLLSLLRSFSALPTLRRARLREGSGRFAPCRCPCRPRLEALEDRLAPSAGQLDPTFGNGGIVTTEFNSSAYAAPDDETGPWAIAVQPNDGKIILAGDTGSATTGYEFAVARYSPNGALDPTFGQNGRVTLSFGSPADLGGGVTIQPDGKILVVGTTYNRASANTSRTVLCQYLPNIRRTINFTLN